MKTPTSEGSSHRAHVIRLDPTVKQANAMQRAAGVARFTYNWALAEWERQYRAGEKPSALKLKKLFNAIKSEQFPWVLESPRDANSQPFADLGVAFHNWFSSLKGERKGRKVGHPTFKKRGVHDAFYVANDKFSVRERGKRGIVRLPVIGDVRMTERLRFSGKILSGRVFRQADQWFIAVAVEVRDVAVQHVHQHGIVGVDLGLKTAVVPSHGAAVDAPKPLKATLKRLRRANRRLHRRRPGGANRRKARMLVAKVHQRAANIRKDFWHKLTTLLCRENQTVVIEDLSVGFMLQNRRLSRAAADVGLGMFRPMMVYKAPACGTDLVVAERQFPSTQRCSSCGGVKAGDERMVLGQSEYLCEECGVVAGRDDNAALNLEQYPRLAGNWQQVLRTPTDDRASTRRASRASTVAEVGTKPERALALTH